jgi:hypothetical protein
VSEDITASAYLVVKGTRSPYWGSKNSETGLYPVREAKITQARQGRPTKVGPDEVLVKVTVQLPKSVFDPITPSALIVVPEEMILDRHEIQVAAIEEAEA